MALQSLPSWECGLKCLQVRIFRQPRAVAPFVGVWIEMCSMWSVSVYHAVAPFVGVWIEITEGNYEQLDYDMSLPSWECGLKYFWCSSNVGRKYRRSLRGSVDWNKNKATLVALASASLPSWECGLKSKPEVSFANYPPGRSLRGSVDWNWKENEDGNEDNGRSLRGSVDWN